MTRFTLPAFLALALPLAASAQPAPPDLGGKTLAETFAGLLPAMGKTDNNAPGSAGQRWQDICFALGAPGNEKLRAEACSLMAAKLDAKTPAAARLWLLAQLQRIGRDESVDAVAALLGDKDDDVREAAVRALAGNASPKATGKLTAKLSDASGKAKVGLLNALGHRGDPEAAGLIARDLKSDDPAVAAAAAKALGRTPGDTTLALLVQARGGVKNEAVRTAVADAMLAHADRKAAAKDTGSAAEIYTLLNVKDEERPTRLAALRGLIQTAGDRGGELVLKTLTDGDAGEQAVAAGQIESLTAPALKTLTGSMEKLPARSRVLVVTAVAARGDRSQLPVAVAAARSTDAEVKRAGVQALGRLGDPSIVGLLLDLMTGRDAAAGVAAESLAALPADGVNEKLVAVLEGEKNAGRAAALISILDRRQAAGAVPALLKAAGGTDPRVRSAAFAALKSLASAKDAQAMIAALLKTAKGQERDAAEVVVAWVASQVPTAEQRAEPVLAAIKSDPKRTADLLPLLGRLGGEQALGLIREAVAATDPALHAAAVAGLCNWPDVTANEDLLAIAGKGKAEEKAAALRALVRVNTVLTERTPAERLAALEVMKAAMGLAARDEERRAILEGLGSVRVIETLRYVVPYLDDPALAQAACKGVIELAHSRMLREPNRAEFAKALDRVIGLCKDRGLVDRAKQYRDAP